MTRHINSTTLTSGCSGCTVCFRGTCRWQAPVRSESSSGCGRGERVQQTALASSCCSTLGRRTTGAPCLLQGRCACLHRAGSMVSERSQRAVIRTDAQAQAQALCRICLLQSACHSPVLPVLASGRDTAPLQQVWHKAEGQETHSRAAPQPEQLASLCKRSALHR